ncbi:MAG: IS5 family transposase, partial [Akkermansiaceae bacterium]
LGAGGIVRLFEHFDGHLAALGFHGKEGIIVDASFVEVPRQRNSRKENQTVKEGGIPEEWNGNPSKLRQKDTDARWAKKNNETHYGYKNHIKCDAKTKLIRRYRASQANLHDSQCFEELLEEGDHTVWADSAYRSKESLRMLRGKKLKARLCAKGTKAKALTPGQKRENRKKSRTRARVEHIFGHQVYLMKADCIRTIGIMRATMQIGLGNLVYNFVRLAEIKTARA